MVYSVESIISKIVGLKKKKYLHILTKEIIFHLLINER